MAFYESGLVLHQQIQCNIKHFYKLTQLSFYTVVMNLNRQEICSQLWCRHNKKPCVNWSKTIFDRGTRYVELYLRTIVSKTNTKNCIYLSIIDSHLFKGFTCHTQRERLG